MPRAKRGFKARRRRNRILKEAKGFVLGFQSVFRRAAEQVDRSQRYAYRDRRNKKRDFRALWVQRINAAARLNDTTYSRLMGDLKRNNIELDRKILADIAARDLNAFSEVVKAAQA